MIAPPTGYGVARVQQEFGASKSIVGVTFTTVQRDLDPLLQPVYTHRAYSGGVDWLLRWDRGAYELRGWLGGTQLQGDRRAINRVQRSSVHFFQRPDADYVNYDSTRTTLGGSIGDLWFRKTKGNWLYDLEYGWESPAYDPNDAGRLGNADGRYGFAGLRYRQTKPGRWYQSYNVSLSSQAEFDYGGDKQFQFNELYGEVTFKNFWNLSSYVDYLPRAFDHSLTRGGPTMATASSWNWVVRLANNFGARNSWVGRVYYGEDELGGETYRLSGELSVRPSTRFQFSAMPNYLRDITPRQFVPVARSDPGRGPLSFARIVKSTFLIHSCEHTVGPDLALRRHGRSPRRTVLRACELAGRGRSACGSTVPTGPRCPRLVGTTPSPTWRCRHALNQDFNILSVNSNAVLRWEWRRGSTLYLVWAQGRFSQAPTARHVGFDDLMNSFTAPGDHFLAVKVSYWIPVN